VGSAAYRAAEKLKSIEAAAYRSGQDLGNEGNEITHDYTRKKGVVHKEIILPENAPKDYEDRETLWRAVEAKEIRKDARLAREIEAALQAELTLQENIELLREYIKENFVDKGMIADFAVHDKKDGNPHVHIMLTTRHVTSDGFGGKNRDWDEDSELLKWRENWAKINNRKFEEKGLDVRIDHRTLKAQGIDREPTIHMGHEAWALEQKGIKTERGDINREINRRNEEHAALKESPHETAETTPDKEKPQKPQEPKKEKETQRKTNNYRLPASELKDLHRQLETQKLEPHIEKLSEQKDESPFISKLETQIKAEKAMQFIEKVRKQQDDAAKIAKRMNELREASIELEKEKIPLIEQHNHIKRELPNLEYLVESLEEHAQNISVLQGRVVQLQELRGRLGLFDLKKKKDADEKIVQATQELGRAQDYFKNHFNIDPSNVDESLNRLQAEIREKKDELNAKQVRVQIINDKQAALELKYHTQKLLNETRPDHEQINNLLKQMRKTPESVREQQIIERIETRLEVVTDYSFEKVIETLPPYQARLITSIREQAKEQKELLRFEREQAFLTRHYQTQDKKEREKLLKAEKEHNYTNERSR